MSDATAPPPQNAASEGTPSGAPAPGQGGQPNPYAGAYPPPPYYSPYPYSPYYPYPYPPPYYPPAGSTTSGLAIASLILSLAGSQLIPIIGPIAGAICGHIALHQIGRAQGRLTGRGLAIAGIVTGYALAALYLVIYGLFLYFLFSFPPPPGG